MLFNLSQDKRKSLSRPYWAGKSGKKLHKGGHGNELVMRGGDGRRDGDRSTLRDLLSHQRRQYGRGPPGPYGGMQPGPGFYSGENLARQHHQDLEEKWGTRGRREVTAYVRGRGHPPPGLFGFPPRPPLPDFERLGRPRHRSPVSEFFRTPEHMHHRASEREFPPIRHQYPQDYRHGHRPPHRYGPRPNRHPPYYDRDFLDRDDGSSIFSSGTPSSYLGEFGGGYDTDDTSDLEGGWGTDSEDPWSDDESGYDPWDRYNRPYLRHPFSPSNRSESDVNATYGGPRHRPSGRW